jgi:hypothetical protein
MNKFKYLQIVGTITVLSPILLLGTASVIYVLSTSQGVEVVETESDAKQDTAKPVKPLVLALPAPAPAPVVKKPVPVPPPAPAPEPAKVAKDTVVKPAVELDTAK